VADILGLVADRFSLETCFRDCKVIVGAGQQQVRHLWASVGAFHVCLWAFAMTEAWAWLEAQGLLVPGDRWNGGSGWRVPSRRAMRFSGVDEFVPYAVARRLDPTILHPRIRATVWSAIVRGHFEIAAFTALKAVEVAVRGAAGYGHDRYGRDMMAMAFAAPRLALAVENAVRHAALYDPDENRISSHLSRVRGIKAARFL
jgi:hypothetical protein